MLINLINLLTVHPRWTHSQDKRFLLESQWAVGHLLGIWRQYNAGVANGGEYLQRWRAWHTSKWAWGWRFINSLIFTLLLISRGVHQNNWATHESISSVKGTCWINDNLWSQFNVWYICFYLQKSKKPWKVTISIFFLNSKFKSFDIEINSSTYYNVKYIHTLNNWGLCNNL